jgi:hypothetical protein
MKTNHIERHFASMGARFKSRLLPVEPWRATDYAIDIRSDARGPYFELRVPEPLSIGLDAAVLNVVPEDRHLLLLLRREVGEARKDRFLCGHDEREWFVAAVPGKASTVREAKQALQPPIVLAALARNGVRARHRFLRRNEAFVRQGEWFFVPERWKSVPELLVRRHEPIRRGAGKPHIVEWLYREGGERVYVCSRHSEGVSEARYTAMVQRDPSLLRLDWRSMARNPRVYARGTVRHPDHATITLREWCRVLLNTETEAPSMPRMAFLD